MSFVNVNLKQIKRFAGNHEIILVKELSNMKRNKNRLCSKTCGIDKILKNIIDTKSSFIEAAEGSKKSSK